MAISMMMSTRLGSQNSMKSKQVLNSSFSNWERLEKPHSLVKTSSLFRIVAMSSHLFSRSVIQAVILSFWR